MITRLVPMAGLVLALTAACTGSSTPDTSHSSTSDKSPVAVLKPAWKANIGDLWNPPVASGSAWAWSTPTSVIVPSDRALTSYSTSSGAKQWTVQLPDQLCAISDNPNGDGIGAVMIGHTHKFDKQNSCGRAAAIDTKTGKLLWTSPLDPYTGYGMDGIQIGPKAVAAYNDCDSAVTLSVADGSKLASFPRKLYSKDCLDSFGSDGTTVVRGRKHVDNGSMIGYDAVSGKVEWTVRTPADVKHRQANAGIDKVIGSRPTVVAADVNQHHLLHSPSRSGDPVFGRQADQIQFSAATAGDANRVVVQYHGSQVLLAYDAASGRQVMHSVLQPGETAVGLRDDQVITVAPSDKLFGNAALAIGSVDLTSGAEQILGAGSISGVAANFGPGVGFGALQSGDTLVVNSADGSTDELVAYRLPATGPSFASLDPSAKWPANDFRPDQVVDLCLGITTQTKRALGFVATTVPAPANCNWLEDTANDRSERFLDTYASAFGPSGRTSGAQSAHHAAVGLTKADSVNKLPRATPLNGLGDEAWVAESPKNSLARVVVRRANVVMYVDTMSDDLGKNGTSLTLLRRGAVLAAKDLLAELDRRR